MRTSDGQNTGNLTLHRGEKYAHWACSAEITHEREVRERFVEMMRTPAGKAVRVKAIYRAAEGQTVPTRLVTRMLRRLKKLGFNEAQRDAALIAPVRKYNAALDGRLTGEHPKSA